MARIALVWELFLIHSAEAFSALSLWLRRSSNWSRVPLELIPLAVHFFFTSDKVLMAAF